MTALLRSAVGRVGQVALAAAAGLSLLAVCAAALTVTLICAAPLRLLQAR